VDPRVLAGTQRQLENWRAELAGGAQRVGWKIAFNGEGVQQRVGIDSPVVGYMTSNTLLKYGARISVAGAANLLVEPEISIEIGPTLDPAALGAAIEIVDVDRPVDDLEAVVASNLFHRGVLFGGSRPGVRPPAEAVVLVNGEERERAEIRFDEWETVGVVSQTLAAAGETLQPGDQIIAGSLTTPIEVTAGDSVGVQIGPLGFLQALFVE
jgi:2-oxo-3-hexenedioate decarboxylase